MKKGEIMELKKINVMSFAKIQGLIGVAIGLIAGVIYALIALIAPFSTDIDISVLRITASLIILFPLIYGVLGFIGGALIAWIYNVIAKRIGGIEIELNK